MAITETVTGRVEHWVELTHVEPPLVAFRHTFHFLDNGDIVSSDSTLRFCNRDEITTTLALHGFTVDDVRDAPDRPGREFVFIARAVLKLSPKPPPDWTDAVIANLGLGHLMQRTPREASYGECHRVMLARSLCTQPSVLLVDKPFAHQDPEMCDSTIGLLGLHASAVDDTCCVVACRRYDSVVWGKPADVTLAV